MQNPVYVIQTKMHGDMFGPFESDDDAMTWVINHAVGCHIIVRTYTPLGRSNADVGHACGTVIATEV